MGNIVSVFVGRDGLEQFLHHLKIMDDGVHDMLDTELGSLFFFDSCCVQDGLQRNQWHAGKLQNPFCHIVVHGGKLGVVLFGLGV